MKKTLTLLLILTLLSGLLLPAGVALGETTTVTFPVDTVCVAVGKSTTARAAAKPYLATKKGIRYTTSDETVATVTAKGVVTGVALGTCQLTATSVYDPTVSQSIPVQVVQPVQKLTVTAAADTVAVGQTLALQVAYEPADATLQGATYESSSESVATVTADGVVTGVKRGTAKITVQSTDGYAKAVYAVTVAQLPEGITVTPESVSGPAGRKVQLKATVSPTTANDKTVQWTSADESIATVNAKGQVTLVSVGQTQILCASSADPAVSVAIPVQGMELAQSVSFDTSLYSVLVGQTTQVYANVLPDATTDKTVTYSVKNKRIATVDENGVVTGVSGGKTIVYATTTDGSKKRAAATVEVIVPVTGVSYKYKDVRVSVGSRDSFTATISPSNASNKAMTWVSSDEGIASVKGTTNRFSVKGRRWGRCKVTGTTEDGSFTVEVYVDVGSLRHAVTVTEVSIRDGKPYLTVKNQSDMNITQVRFLMQGYDLSLQPIVMSTIGDAYVLEGSYNMALAPGESSRHGRFTFYNASDFDGLAELCFCITGWSTDTGFYDRNGKLQKNYTLTDSQLEWVSYPANSDVLALVH